MYWILSSYSHTITEWLTLEETTGGLLVQHSQPQLDVFWTSWKRETLQPLWVPKCSITFNIKMCYLVFRQNWLCSNDPLPFVVALGTTEKSLSLLYTFYTLIISVSCPLSSSPTSQTFPSRFWTVPALSSSSQERCSSHFIIFMVLFWTLSSMSNFCLSLGTGVPRVQYKSEVTAVLHPRIGLITSDVSSPVLNRGKGSPPSSCDKDTMLVYVKRQKVVKLITYYK